MKKVLLIGALSLMTMISCKKEEKQVDVIESGSTDTTVVVHDEAPAPPAVHDTVVVKPDESEGTSVKINSSGVDISSKNGDKKTSVDVDVKK